MQRGHKDFDDKILSDWYYSPKELTGYRYVVYWLPHKDTGNFFVPEVTIDEIWRCCKGGLRKSVHSWKDMCLSLSLSHLLQRRFFGLECAESKLPMTRDFVLEGLLLEENGVVNYERAFKVIEVELAFLYDVFFTSNAFLYYYESKVATIWACASALGICFVGVAAVIPGTRSARTSGGTIVVGTTTADLVVTVVILVSLASLQVLQLLRCWTSNWARVALVCDYMRNEEQASCWMRLRALLLRRINCFDNCLWQDKLGQYSLIESISTGGDSKFFIRALGVLLYKIYSLLSEMLGLQYIEQVLREIWGVQTGDAVALHADVKAAVVDFILATSRESNQLIKTGTSPLPFQIDAVWRSYCRGRDIVEVILKWHVATCYCELDHQSRGGTHSGEMVARNHGVATALSKYCAYLVASAPQLLPGQHVYTKSMHDGVVLVARLIMQGANDRLEAMNGIWSALSCDDADPKVYLEKVKMIFMELNQDEAMEAIGRSSEETENFFRRPGRGNAWKVAKDEFVKFKQAHDGFRIFWQGLELGRRLEGSPDTWKVLADFWVQALLYATPSGNVEEHMEHLAQGGEFITHLWALLSHAGILKQEWNGTEV